MQTLYLVLSLMILSILGNQITGQLIVGYLNGKGISRSHNVSIAKEYYYVWIDPDGNYHHPGGADYRSRCLSGW